MQDGPQERCILPRCCHCTEEAAFPLAVLPHGSHNRAPAEEVLPRLFPQPTKVTGVVRMVRTAQRLQEPGWLGPWCEGDPRRIIRA